MFAETRDSTAFPEGFWDFSFLAEYRGYQMRTGSWNIKAIIYI